MISTSRGFINGQTGLLPKTHRSNRYRRSCMIWEMAILAGRIGGELPGIIGAASSERAEVRGGILIRFLVTNQTPVPSAANRTRRPTP